MKNTTKLQIVVVSILLSACAAHKINSEYNNLVNTTWEYVDFEKKYDITFKKNKIIQTTDSADTTPRNDKWSQSNEKIGFSFNDKYAEYNGIIYKDSITGMGKNKDTLWSFKMIRKK